MGGAPAGQVARVAVAKVANSRCHPGGWHVRSRSPFSPCIARQEPAMADPQAAVLTQLRNIQTRAGRTIAELHAAIAASGLVKVSERRAWAMERFKLGYGDANTLALTMGKPLPDLALAAGAAPAASPAATEADALDAIYSGTKAHLRPLHEVIMAAITAFGPFERAPKKAYVSLRRKKQFAMVGPATKDQIEIGLNHKALPAHPRLKALPPGGMCNASLRLATAAEVDGELRGWLRAAYDAAG
jgi:Domain of unknown function (DUF5655)/Domain of unknown function (DUF4287)